MCDILNSPLVSGVLPLCWKRTCIVPIPKVTPTPSLDKLRPISIACTLAKICETFVSRCLTCATFWIQSSMETGNDALQLITLSTSSPCPPHHLVHLITLSTSSPCPPHHLVHLITLSTSSPCPPHRLVHLINFVLSEAEAGKYVNLLTADYSIYSNRHSEHHSCREAPTGAGRWC